jgi:hypothetical protein
VSRLMPWAAAAAQGLLIVVFLASAAGKLRGRRSLRAFASSLVSLRLVGPGAAVPVAAAVAAAEAGAAVLLVGTRTAGFAAAVVLLSVLSLGVAVVLARGTAAPCRCFGASATPLSRRHLVRNALLTGAAVLGLAAPAGSPPGALLAVAAGVAAGVLVVVMDDLVALFAPPGGQRSVSAS